MNNALEKENAIFKAKFSEQEEEIAKLRKRLQIEDDPEIYPETEKPATGSENDFITSKGALRVRNFYYLRSLLYVTIYFLKKYLDWKKINFEDIDEE